MKRILFFVTIIVAATALNAQVGSWRMHFGYNSVTDVVETPNKVFALASGTIYSVDKRDESVEIYSKMSGLNDTDIAAIAYNRQAKTLVIAYATSNIDLITDDGIFNLSGITTNKYVGSKSINSIYMNGNFAYLACDFGIAVLNLTADKREFAGDTYLPGLPVSSITMSDTHIYAASGTEIYKALKDDKNLYNNARWEVVSKEGLSATAAAFETKTIVYWSGRLYALKYGSSYPGNVYYKADTGTWTAGWTGSIRSIREKEDRLLMNNANTIRSYDTSHNYTAIATTYNPILAVEYLAKEDQYWLAGDAAGLINWTAQKVHKLSGPALKDARDIYTFGDKIFVNTSCQWDPVTDENIRIAAAVMTYSTATKTWSNIVKTNLLTPAVNADRNLFVSTTCLVADPRDNTHFFVATGYGGLYEFRDNVFFKRHNVKNSLIRTYGGGTGDDYERIYGLFYDNDGENLWLFNSNQPTNQFQILKRDDSWIGLSYNTLIENNEKEAYYKYDYVYIDSYNNKWGTLLRYNPEGIFVLNENKTLENQTDDKTRKFNATSDANKFIYTENGQDVPFFSLGRCFAEDTKNKKMWIGTDAGPIIFEDPKNVFTSNRITRPKISRNDGSGFADYLLSDIQITSIVVDGDNRKWLATTGYGIYLVSENGTEVIQHFDTNNSPLLTDNINSLALSKTGELFIATDLGICSYQTDATEANLKENPFENVYAFPNPVREDYDGVISITGLQVDTNVKIADINGNIIYETTSHGGMATWDGKNKYGQKVSTGIYLVYAALEDASESIAAKILIVNK